MKFLVDAQLPASLSEFLKRRGFDSMHTSELPMANMTTDGDVCAFAQAEQRVVITKDSDFVQSHLLSKIPQKILIVNTGNIKNSKLLAIFELVLSDIIRYFSESDYIEITQTSIIVR